MTNWTFDKAANAGTLMLSGEVTIHHVSDLKTALLEAFDSVERVTVDVSAATAVDVAGVQLLCACRRFSSVRNKQMCLRLGDNTRFAGFLGEIGFPLSFICDHGENDKCVWASEN